jgi:agmatinase
VTKDKGDRAFTAESLYGSKWESAYAGAQSFLRRRYTHDLAGVDVAVLGVPFDLATSNRPGARFGPGAIRRASAQLAWGEVWPWGFDPFERLAVVDCGDVAYHWGQAEEMLENVEARAGEVLAAGCALLALGGDHFVTLPLLRAHAKVHGPLALVHFDAHTDTGDGPHTDHGTMFRHAVREGLIEPEASVQVGIRTAYDAAAAFHVLDAPRVHEAGTRATVEEIARVVAGRKAYLTFDIDCLDPAFAPGTGTPVVGGLATAQALAILRALGGLDLVGMDVVEVAPIYDVGEVTSLAAATLALEYLCLLAAKAPQRA